MRMGALKKFYLPLQQIVKDMNKKEEELHKIVDIVIDCCSMSSSTHVVTKEKVLGGCREENCVMTRCLLTYAIMLSGYTITTVAQLLGMKNPGVRALMAKDGEYQHTSRAYRVAKIDINERLRELIKD